MYFYLRVKNSIRSTINTFSLELYESEKWKEGDRLGSLTRALMNNSVDMAASPMSMITLRLVLIRYVHQDWPFR